jgi:hypothetical protein
MEWYAKRVIAFLMLPAFIVCGLVFAMSEWFFCVIGYEGPEKDS